MAGRHALRTERRKQEWFDLGAAAAERLFGRPVGYVCPLCVHAFPSTALLSLEHAPPESIGGKEVCLTCRQCNNSAGSSVDGQLALARERRDWSRGDSSKRQRATLDVGGNRVRFDLERTPDLVTTLHSLPLQNNPVESLAFDEALKRALDDAGEAGIKYRFRPIDDRHVRVSLLRAAYLVAFAVLGCRYALRTELKPVRQQIANPDDDVLGDRYCTGRPYMRAGRRIAQITSPSLEGLVVHIDDALVFLPLRDGTIYDRLDARKIWPPRRNFLQRVALNNLEWPTRPMHLMDEPVRVLSKPRDSAER